MVGIDKNIASAWSSYYESENTHDPNIVGDPAYLVQGDADIDVHLNPGYNFDDRKIDVAFTNIVGINSGASYPDLSWRVWMGPESAKINNFRDSLGSYYCPGGNDCHLPQDGTIGMRFAGPNHEEVIGHFATPDMEGMFGAKRQ